MTDFADHEPPAFWAMLHLLGIGSLAAATVLWGLALLVGMAEGSWLRASPVLVGLVGAALWLTWLVRAAASAEGSISVDRAVVGVDQAP